MPYDNERETQGDGNCFYNAIIDQIVNNPRVAETLSEEGRNCSTPKDLREKVIDFIMKWPDALNHDTLLLAKDIMITAFRERKNLPACYTQEGILQQYLLPEQRECGVFAEDFIIQCTPTFLGKDIYVISQGTAKNRQNQTKWLRIPSYAGTKGPPITLASNQSTNSNESGGEHFQSVIPRTTAESEPKVCRNCAKKIKQNIKSHLNQSKIDCWNLYDKDLMCQEAKAKAREKSREKQARYDAKNQSQIRTKQANYKAEHREQNRKRKADYNDKHREQNRKRQKVYNEKNKEQIQKKQVKQKQAARAHLLKNQTALGRLRAFRRLQRKGLSFVCASCKRLWFEGSVTKVNERSSHLLKLLDMDFKKEDQKYLCGTCRKYLSKGQIPPLCFKNGLEIEAMPKNLELTELESVLCSKNILFVKIHTLPKSLWKGSKEKVVNVPISSEDLKKTFDKITSFPRQPTEAGLMPVFPVKLKRKLCWKRAYLKKMVNAETMVRAVQHFKALGNPLYQDVNINTDYIPEFTCDEPQPQHSESEKHTDNSLQENTSAEPTEVQQSDENNEQLIPEDDSVDISDDEDDRLASVKENQFEQAQHFVMANDHPESLCVTSSSVRAKELCVAPGEGKIPINTMRDENWDVGGFPDLHPSGKFGLHHEREKKITAKNYFLQRLQNENPQFRKSKPYLFSAVYHCERQQFEQRISLSVQRGVMKDGNLDELNDAMSVFEEVKGTPKYWQKIRTDMIAKIKQLGPFQFFFTLSCADKRWAENFVSILTQLGHNVVFQKSGCTGNIEKDEVEAFVDGLPLKDFIKENYPHDRDLHEMVKDNVFTITKVFDKRVRNFINEIIRGKNSPMRNLHYQYRIEFQSRGAGHAHGVLWLDLSALDSDFPGIKDIFKSIRTNSPFDIDQISILRTFIDTFISCSLQNKTVSQIVKEVQIHHHTKTCHKYGSKCRFNFPKFPSEETIIAQPLCEDDFPTILDMHKYQKDLESVLTKVRHVLENMDHYFSHDTLFKEHLLAKVTLDDVLLHAEIGHDLESARYKYYEALRVTRTGKVIILKRTVQEMWVNNYNPEWLHAWDGNMDIQLCLDFFAICTYITDYYTKDESGTVSHLLKAAKECHGKSQKEKMRALSQVFSTHRHVGESEAYYKICPELHLSHSSIQTVYEHTGFPENRRIFLRRLLTKDENGNALPDEEENEEN